MSAFEKPADMVRRASSVLAPNDILLGLPPPGPRECPVQPYDLFVHDRFQVLSVDKRMYGDLVVVAARFEDARGRILMCQNVNTGRFHDISDYVLGELDRAGRLRIVKQTTKGLLPNSPASMTPEQIAVATRNRGYVMAAIDQAAEEGKAYPKGGTFLRAIAKYAKRHNDPAPPSYVTVRKYWKALPHWPEIDLRAFLPPVSSGNKERGHTIELEELVKTCAIGDRSRGSPNLADLKSIVLEMLRQPEYEHLFDQAFDEKGNFRPSDSWFYKKRAELNRYDADRSLLGPDAADRARRNRATRPRAENALDIVDVDYTTLNVMVYDARFKFVYGRPNVIFFRDRATGAVVGFAVFFDNPSFEAVWHGFKRMIYPKDMSRYPDWDYPMYGYPMVIVVDNDATLISDAVIWLCERMGIRHRKGRVARPTDKAGVEQHFAKQDTKVIHNLPGSTEKSPAERDKFDASKMKAIAVLTLEELEARIMQYICVHLHNRRLTGFDRGAKTVKQHWLESIAKVTNRPVVNPEEFLRAGGFHVPRLVIRGGNTIVHNHIEYYSVSLAAISDDHRHRDRDRDGETLFYDGIIAPENVGSLSVINPYDRGSLITIKASDKWREYAEGRSLSQHQAAVDHHARTMKSEIDGPSDLDRAAMNMTEEMRQAALQLKSQRAAQQFLAYHSDLAQRTELGRVVDVASSPVVSAVHLDPEDAVALPPVRRSETDAPSPFGETPDRAYVEDEDGLLVRVDPASIHLPARSQKSETDSAEGDEPVDIEALRKQYGWDE